MSLVNVIHIISANRTMRKSVVMVELLSYSTLVRTDTKPQRIILIEKSRIGCISACNSQGHLRGALEIFFEPHCIAGPLKCLLDE